MDSTVSAFLPTNSGDFQIFSFPGEEITALPDIAMLSGVIDPDSAVLLRIHSECLTGDVFGSQRCDCGQQLRLALEYIGETGGVLIYLRQEGRGIGLHSKIEAYKKQEDGMDTVQANTELGFKPDERNYEAALKILKFFGIKKVRLLTNNPDKISALELGGISIVERIPISFPSNPFNDKYLKTKRDKMGHILPKITE